MADLLPPNATTEETALAETVSRVGDVPVPIRTLWDPDTISADLLPWLAWAFSVDDWDASWPESTKRAAISAAVGIHRKKGTAQAVKDAIAVVNKAAEVLEWFETNGQPYTFSVYIDVTSTGINATELNRIEQTALSAKNVRSHLQAVDPIIVSSDPLHVGAAFSDSILAESTPFPRAIESRP